MVTANSNLFKIFCKEAHALNLCVDTLTSCEQESIILDYFEPDDSDSGVKDLLSDGELILFIVNRILSSVTTCK